MITFRRNTLAIRLSALSTRRTHLREMSVSVIQSLQFNHNPPRRTSAFAADMLSSLSYFWFADQQAPQGQQNGHFWMACLPNCLVLFDIFAGRLLMIGKV